MPLAVASQKSVSFCYGLWSALPQLRPACPSPADADAGADAHAAVPVAGERCGLRERGASKILQLAFLVHSPAVVCISEVLPGTRESCQAFERTWMSSRHDFEASVSTPKPDF